MKKNTEIKSSKNKELKKHISMIHCVNNLSLLQRKISNALLFHAYSSLQKQEEHTISINELCKYLNYNGYNYEAIKQALKALVSIVIEWNVIDNSTQDEDWTASSILASVNIKKAICSYAYSPRMRQLLSYPSMYGIIDLAVQAKFTSGYGLALYENCSRYRKLKKTKIFTIEQFKKIMGVSEEKYLIFRDFKKRVLDKAVEEVNALSDLSIELNLIKTNNSVVGLCFDIYEKKPIKQVLFGDRTKNNKEDKLLLDNDLLLDKLRKIYCISDSVIKVLMQTYDRERIVNKIKQIESTRAFKSGNIANIAGFLVDALKKDYTPNKTSGEVLKENKTNKDAEVNKNRQQDFECKKLQQQYSMYLENQLNVFIDEIGERHFNELLHEFKAYIGNNNIFLKMLSKHGLASKVIKNMFRVFLMQHKVEYANRFISFEQYTNQACID